MKTIKKTTSKRFRIRSDRYPNPNAIASLQLPNATYEVLNYSVTGIAVVTSQVKSPFNRDHEVQAQFIVDGFKVFPLQLKFLYQAPTEESKSKLAFEIVGSLLDAEKVMAVIETAQIIRRLNEQRARTGTLPLAYRNFILEAAAELNSFREALNKLDATFDNIPFSLKDSRQRGIIRTASEFFARRLRSFYIDLEKFLSSCHSDQERIYREYFHTHFKDFLWRELPSQWSSSLPPSSQGTYGSVGLGLRGTMEGNDVFSKALGIYYTNLIGAEALQNRSAHLSGSIKNILSTMKTSGPTRILSVASGLNSELENVFTTHENRPLAVTVLDSEMNFLQETQILMRDLEQNNRSVGGSLHFEHWATRDYLEKLLKDEDPFDLIYSSYLLDFISEDDVMVYLPVLWDALASGGALVLANISKEFRLHFALELELNWNLVARTSPDLANLAISLTGNTQAITIEPDQNNTNLFLILRKV